MFDARAPRHVDSVFIPGRKRVVNVVALCLNVFLPWFTYTAIFFLLIISFHHRDPDTTWGIVAAVALLPLVSIGVLAYVNAKSYDPNWFKMSWILHFLAVVGGLFCGEYTYLYQLAPYYSLAQLQTYPQLDVSKTPGLNVQDAGRVYFAAGTHIDLTRSWHFQAGSVYCVAPIVGPGQDPNAQVDFWAIGKDCCATAASDFRCGDYTSQQARSGLRFLESDSWFPERHLYRLAVAGAEGLYGLTAPNPIFFTWVVDPLHHLTTYRDTGWGYFMLGMQAFFTLNVLIVILTTLRFALIGRGEGEGKPLLENEEA